MANFAFLSQLSLHRQVFVLALPMVLSNITVPLLGLVDAAVIGHLEHSWYLGGVAVGGTMISVTFWLLGFLRMATTGLSAQAFGARDGHQQGRVLVQGLIMAWGFALALLLIHPWVADAVMYFSDASEAVKLHAESYFSIRIWGAPAALANLVLMGWLLGLQNARVPMWLLIITNAANIVFDLLFVLVFDWKVEGAAAASVCAEYLGFLIGMRFALGEWRRLNLPKISQLVSHSVEGLGRFVRLNRDIFLRSLSLQAAFTFMTFQGASLGDDIVAANAVLMSFLMLISFAMDGFAYAIEAMVGKAVGAKDRRELWYAMVITTLWSGVIALGIALVFGLQGQAIIGLISSIDVVQQQASQYLPWLVAMPLVSMWCFLLDGIFIGATRGREMRNSMFLASCCFFLVWWLCSAWGNHALWAAMLSFMAMRGLTLAWVFWRHWQADTFLVTER
nr:MATE family efflux transporter DinF [Thaumasiovibrio subtropicus]